MRRSERMQEDLDYYLGPKWYERAYQSVSLQKYLQHLDRVESQDPALLLVYSFHMHMAICAGGSIIRRMVRKALELPPSVGTRTFEFDRDGSYLSSLKRDYKAAMNQLGETRGSQFAKTAVEESTTLFKLNNSVVNDFRITSYEVVRGMMIGFAQAVCNLCSFISMPYTAYAMIAAVAACVMAVAAVQGSSGGSDMFTIALLIMVGSTLGFAGVGAWFVWKHWQSLPQG
mmetsp:Transcript_20814/g.49617  ORF Transcript_20814/g.49617 Transcript_20814/m.49617 type:complete len:229 (-) Transcript_20814:351-1037(-)